jgi:immunity protein, SdpI family
MRSRWFGYWAILVAATVSLLVYPKLPVRVVMHFNAAGEPNGYGSRLDAVLLLPLVMLGLRVLFAVLPRIDPRRDNYARFGDTYWLLVNGLLLFLGVVHVALLAYALGVPLRIDRVIAAGWGVLLVMLGSYLGRVEPNWFVGIRTPWTLSSEQVWQRTHRVGGRIVLVGGALCVLTVLLPTAAALPVLAGVTVAVALLPVVLSYAWWKQEGH